ncbi:MAG: signal peptidase [Pseudonocardiales bacterium]|nr:signal peptidase [Pseudonocardiales bacterium]
MTVVIYLAIYVLVVAGLWKVFEKAGHEGWKAIIPIYNVYIELKIVGRPGWWLVLFIIPIVNIVMLFIVSFDMAKSFGKSTGFGVGLALLSFIFIPILGFGSARYLGPSVQPQAVTA